MATILTNALTTLARTKAYLGISGDSQDTALVMLINMATGTIEQYCKRRFKNQEYSNDIYDGTGTSEIVLRQFPVTELESLEVNTNTIGSPSWQTVEASRYGFYSDGRVALGPGFQAFLPSDAGQFLIGPQRYLITYTAGYLIDFDHEADPAQHNLPPELEQACLNLVGAYMNARKSQGLKSAKVGDITMVFKDSIANDAETKAVLERYAAASI